MCRFNRGELSIHASLANDVKAWLEQEESLIQMSLSERNRLHITSVGNVGTTHVDATELQSASCRALR
ncbi:hypothetical protein A9R05_27795 [Burkholderia sp. KK1]|nr:hypothetical protein A9R05_27795 [Burkholderia sp. KK1]